MPEMNSWNKRKNFFQQFIHIKRLVSSFHRQFWCKLCDSGSLHVMGKVTKAELQDHALNHPHLFNTRYNPKEEMDISVILMQPSRFWKLKRWWLAVFRIKNFLGKSQTADKTQTDLTRQLNMMNLKPKGINKNFANFFNFKNYLFLK